MPSVTSARRRASRRHAAGPTCLRCGCTEANACLTHRMGELRGCAWVIVDRRTGFGLCSACASIRDMALVLIAKTPCTAGEIAFVIGRSCRSVLTELHVLERQRRAVRVAPRDGGAAQWRRA